MRSPRFFEPLPQDVIDIEAPPQKQSRKKQPMLFVLGPALTMPLPMLATMVLRMGIGNGMGSYWVMGVSVVMSALIGLGWSLARRKYDARAAAPISVYAGIVSKADRRTGCGGTLEPQRAGRGFYDRSPWTWPNGHLLHDSHARSPVQHPKR